MSLLFRLDPLPCVLLQLLDLGDLGVEMLGAIPQPSGPRSEGGRKPSSERCCRADCRAQSLAEETNDDSDHRRADQYKAQT